MVADFFFFATDFIDRSGPTQKVWAGYRVINAIAIGA